MKDFDLASVKNSLAADADQNATSGKVEMRGIFLHPMPQGDAVVTFPHVVFFDLGRRTFLVLDVGMRDGIPWDAKVGTPNGVRFMIAVDGKTVLSVDRACEGWRPCAVDMGPWAGRAVSVEFRTNAIDGNTSYDWAAFGRPLLVQLDETKASPIASGLNGLAIAEIECQEPSNIALKIGVSTTRVELETGTWWIPLEFSTFSTPIVEVAKGQARMKYSLAMPYRPCLSKPRPELSSALLTEGMPANVFVTVKNDGTGTQPEGEEVKFYGWVTERAEQFATASRSLGRLGPGESRILRWNSFTPTAGKRRVDAIVGLQGDCVSFHVFDEEPAMPVQEHGDEAFAVATPDGKIAGGVGNAWSRILIVCEGGYGYGVAETWTDKEWHRVGSLYPLGTLRVGSKDINHDVVSPITAVEAKGNVLSIRAKNELGEIVWTFTPDAAQPRIRMQTRFTATADAPLLALYGPTCLIGDRAGGLKKDFAIFPGLEYLEGDEESSSERDLAPPLNDRRVPLAYKIATPLMAVQASDTLMALLWDENQEWTPGERLPAARFLAPKPDSGLDYIHASIFAPSVGKYVKENEYDASQNPYPLKAGQVIQLDSWLVLDHKARYPKDHMVNGPHRGGLVLQAMQHWFDVYGSAKPASPGQATTGVEATSSVIPAQAGIQGEGTKMKELDSRLRGNDDGGAPSPTPQPREWDAERALCRDAYLHAVWSEEPPGWSHCAGWQPGPMVAYAVPLMLELRAGVPDADRHEVQRRIDTVFDRTLKEQGKHFFWSNAGAHILLGELPFYTGYVAESMRDFRQQGLGLLAQRTAGQWVWQPGEEKLAKLGYPGDSTLAQAAQPSYVALRAARMTGSRELADEALAAMKQMEQYEVPRGAQTWECPLYQPDILAAAQAIRAYCEAYRLTGDPANLEHARYWAWTGLPFLYSWTLDGYPTMKYNVISVIGSTFFTHSWIGLPVVWCGLVYAYAIQDLAEFDTSFDWRRVAQGITNSAMWQQYTEGPSKGTYPDSWSMAKNKPNPADINPENILVNEFRLRGQSPEIRCARLERNGQRVFINSAADIADAQVVADTNAIRFSLKLPVSAVVYTLVAPVDEPKSVTGVGERVADSDALQACETGWLYDTELKGVVIRKTVEPTGSAYELCW